MVAGPQDSPETVAAINRYNAALQSQQQYEAARQAPAAPAPAAPAAPVMSPAEREQRRRISKVRFGEQPSNMPDWASGFTPISQDYGAIGVLGGAARNVLEAPGVAAGQLANWGGQKLDALKSWWNEPSVLRGAGGAAVQGLSSVGRGLFGDRGIEALASPFATAPDQRPTPARLPRFPGMRNAAPRPAPNFLTQDYTNFGPPAWHPPLAKQAFARAAIGAGGRFLRGFAEPFLNPVVGVPSTGLAWLGRNRAWGKRLAGWNGRMMERFPRWVYQGGGAGTLGNMFGNALQWGSLPAFAGAALGGNQAEGAAQALTAWKQYQDRAGGWDRAFNSDKLYNDFVSKSDSRIQKALGYKVP